MSKYLKKESYNDFIGINYKKTANNVKHIIDPNKSLFSTDVTFKDYRGDSIIKVSKFRTNMTLLGGRLHTLEQTFGLKHNTKMHLYLDEMIPQFPISEVPNINNFGGISTAHKFKFYDFSPSNKNNIIGPTDMSKCISIRDNFEEHHLNLVKPTCDGRYVKYFCIGNGAESKDLAYHIYEPTSFQTCLFNMVPFRVVPKGSDLPPDERQKYAMKFQIDYNGVQYYAYYARAIEISVDNDGDPTLFSKLNDSDYTTDSVVEDDRLVPDHSVPAMEGSYLSGSIHLSYVTIKLTIGSEDFKEYYRLTHQNSLKMAKLSELGLIVSGITEVTDMGGSATVKELMYPELFAKMTHASYPMEDESTWREVAYNIYT